MREVGSFEAKTHLASLLDAALAGETIVITKHGKPVAHLCPPDTASRERAKKAAETLKTLRGKVSVMTNHEIIKLRDQGRR